MKLIKTQAQVADTKTIVHGVELPSSFTSEAERSALLNKVMELRDDDKLTKEQSKEIREKIATLKVAVATTDTGVAKVFIHDSRDLYGSFDMVTGRSKGGSSDLLKDWNKASTYDCSDALFQVATGIMKLLCYKSKDVDSTVFNSIVKRAVNNIKSQLVSFQTNSGQPNTTVNGDRSTLSESQYALKMVLDRIDTLIDILYQVLELIDGCCEALGGEINLENVRAAMKAEAEAQAKAEAEAQAKAEAEAKAESVETQAKTTETQAVETQAEPEKVAA